MSLESGKPEPSAQEPGEPEPELAQPGGQRWRVLDDPLAIRALAHPLRMDLLSVISRLGKATTAEAAREIGISHGLASHHLHQLAKYGFVEQVAGKDHRERPWRRTATSYRWPDTQRPPAATAAADLLEQAIAERVLADFLDWQQRRVRWPAEWLGPSGIGTSTIYLTLAEFTELSAAIEGLILPYVEARVIDDVAARPAGSVPVGITVFAVPDAENPPPATEAEKQQAAERERG
jgi:DNA-binding transcriptional ArsR family regulator